MNFDVSPKYTHTFTIFFQDVIYPGKGVDLCPFTSSFSSVGFFTFQAFSKINQLKSSIPTFRI